MVKIYKTDDEFIIIADTEAEFDAAAAGIKAAGVKL